MKKFVLIFAALVALSSTPAMATGNQCDWSWWKKGMCPEQQQQGVEVDVSLEAYNKAYSTSYSSAKAAADAEAAAKAAADASVEGSGNSTNRIRTEAEGGDALAISGGGDGGSAKQGQGQGQTLNGGDILISGDSINHEVAANKRLVVSSGCQESTAADSIKYGVAVVKQSPACLLLTTSTDALIFAASMNCADFQQSLEKGTGTPNPSACLRTRSELVSRALGERQMAVDIIARDAKQGWLKKAFNWVW
jgi:hypothetical protein